MSPIIRQRAVSALPSYQETRARHPSSTSALSSAPPFEMDVLPYKSRASHGLVWSSGKAHYCAALTDGPSRPSIQYNANLRLILLRKL